MKAALLSVYAFGVCLGAVAFTTASASAVPTSALRLADRARDIQLTRCCRYRHNPPVYPYWYRPPTRPGGYSFYFGFVPYNRGDYESQAIQRLYPESNWPPSMRAPYPP